MYAQTLQRAGDKIGGVGPLAEALGVPSEPLILWVQGKGHPPRDVFLRAVDLLNAREGKQPLKKVKRVNAAMTGILLVDSGSQSRTDSTSSTG